jgi:hypothetical protein
VPNYENVCRKRAAVRCWAKSTIGQVYPSQLVGFAVTAVRVESTLMSIRAGDIHDPALTKKSNLLSAFQQVSAQKEDQKSVQPVTTRKVRAFINHLY